MGKDMEAKFDINKPWKSQPVVESCACHFIHGAYVPCLVHQEMLPYRVQKVLFEIGEDKWKQS